MFSKKPIRFIRQNLCCISKITMVKHRQQLDLPWFDYVYLKRMFVDFFDWIQRSSQVCSLRSGVDNGIWMCSPISSKMCVLIVLWVWPKSTIGDFLRKIAWRPCSLSKVCEDQVEEQFSWYIAMIKHHKPQSLLWETNIYKKSMCQMIGIDFISMTWNHKSTL